MSSVPDSSPDDLSLDWLIAAPMRRPRRRAGRWIAGGAAGLGLLAGGYALLHRTDRAMPDRSPAARLARPPAGAPFIDAPFAPTALRPLAPDQAIRWNAAAPLATGPNPAAAAFVEPLRRATDVARSLQCLTMAVYYEAGNEPVAGERAVAQVVLNRVRHVSYPHTVCGVVFQGAERRTGCQFTFACDGSLARRPDETAWAQAELVAREALAGYVYAPVGLATHYHADYVVPYWAASLDRVAVVGRQIFYRWRGGWGTRAAFTGGYAGAEPGLPVFAQPDAVPTDAAAIAAPPAEVPVAERPALVPGTTPAAATIGKDQPRPVATEVKPQARWILPHIGAGDPAPVPVGERGVIVSPSPAP